MNATAERAPSGATRTIRTAAGSTAELVIIPDPAARRTWERLAETLARRAAEARQRRQEGER